MARLISGKTPRATAEVQVAILPASTLSWGISADLIPHFDYDHKARLGGPCGVLDRQRWNFSEKSARVVEETAFAAYCLCVTSSSSADQEMGNP
jgi:hypothetical protein